MQTETAITERLRRSNTEFRALEESHHRLDAELADLQRRHVLTPAEEALKKQLQKEKNWPPRTRSPNSFEPRVNAGGNSAPHVRCVGSARQSRT